MAEAAVTAAIFLFEKAEVFLGEVNSKKDVKDDIEHIQEGLGTIQAYLRDKRGEVGSEMQRDRIKQLRVVAYDIEDVLDEFQLAHVPHFHQHTISQMAHDAAHSLQQFIALQRLSSKIKHVRAKIDGFNSGINAHLHPGEGSTSLLEVEDHPTNQIIYHQEDEIVGFEKHKAKLMEQIIQDIEGEASSIIAVVGAPGSGKSLLVENVYKDRSVVRKYGRRAWIHVSRSVKIDELLCRMVSQFSKGRDPPGIDVQDKLKHMLNHKSYLLVLDDLWNTQDWTKIVNALPSHFGRRRIIITTRDFNVANQCVLSRSKLHVHELHPLSWPDAWHLFCNKAFNGKCPQELVKLSQRILTKCEGLPFAIVASCFLHFSIFPEDYSVKRARLIRLWIAEGFIKQESGKTVEEIAEDCLNELIGTNLVQVSSWDFDGRASTCRVPSLVREFLIRKSEGENFVTILAEPRTAQGEKPRARRLSVQCSRSILSSKRYLDLSCIRTLCMFKWCDSFSSDIRKLLDQFKFLKVLDLEGAPLGIFPEEIFKLTLLKYLSLRETKIKKVPKSIKKLAFLETLNLKHTDVTVLPFEILALKYLRHLLVYCYNVDNYVTFDSVRGVDVPAGIGTLSELQKLSLIRVTSPKVIQELGALTNLTKLGVLGLRKEDGNKLCEAIMKMQKLLSLEVNSARQDEYLELDEMANCPQFLQRLSLKGRLVKLPRWISSLDSLVRIYLRWSKLSVEPLTALEALPNLLELEMVDAYMGEKLEFKANSFMKLKILHLEDLGSLNTVIVEETAMPKLEKLAICKCKKLEMPPLGIHSLIGLEELLLYDMNESFLSCLRKDHEDRWMVDHINTIHSFTLDPSNKKWSFKNLS
ncbi:Disease resistance protein [Corchorus capsularis]|uniref:Disease resistance protein n=1 Tax=Corchorus capsularis TaxID=210143 RepID=A0A1R3I956_COCAP|nr:Disease resistance protein [Corchorus capsularis]